MNCQKTAASLAVSAVCMLSAITAQAALINSFQFNGRGNWSLDAGTMNAGSLNPESVVQASVPTGSTVIRAFLYTSLIPRNQWLGDQNFAVVFDGTKYLASQFVALGENSIGLQAFRTDVTAQVAAKVGGGSASLFNFNLGSASPFSSDQDGQALVVIYSNPAERERTIAILDGFSQTTGDNFTINLANPLTASQLADPSFEAMLSLGIGFSIQPSGQFSNVDINGKRLSSCAGGNDDGFLGNGGLITIGGIGDSPSNPSPGCSSFGGSRVDDELYTLKPFLSAGDTQIFGTTFNPSNDDNIFFTGLNLTAVAGVTVPEPGSVSLSLLGLGIFGLVGRAARRRRS